MAPFQRNVSFLSVDMTYLLRNDAKLPGRIFQESMTFITKEDPQPTSIVELEPWSKLEDAIAPVQEDKQVGRAIMAPMANAAVLVGAKVKCIRA